MVLTRLFIWSLCVPSGYTWRKSVFEVQEMSQAPTRSPVPTTTLRPSTEPTSFPTTTSSPSTMQPSNGPHEAQRPPVLPTPSPSSLPSKSKGGKGGKGGKGSGRRMNRTRNVRK